MGILNRKKNDEEFLTILAEIRDNLNKDDELKLLESKIADAHYSNDEELGVWTNRLVELENKHIELNKGVGALVKNYANLSNKVNDYEGIINSLQDLVEKQDEKIETLLDVTHRLLEISKIKNIKDNPVKPKVKKVKGNVFNAYGKNWSANGYVNINNIVCLTKDGKFKRNGRGKQYYEWTIHTIIKLEKIMQDPVTYPTFKDLGEAVGFSGTTVKDLGYYILNGDFKPYLNEWEQIEMDKMYGNWKPEVENNPIKRKEKGYC